MSRFVYILTCSKNYCSAVPLSGRQQSTGLLDLSFEARHKEKSRNSNNCFCFFGPSVEIRTRGLLNPIQARYQTSPHPDKCLPLKAASIYYHTLSENASTFQSTKSNTHHMSNVSTSLFVRVSRFVCILPMTKIMVHWPQAVVGNTHPRRIDLSNLSVENKKSRTTEVVLDFLCLFDTIDIAWLRSRVSRFAYIYNSIGNWK